MISGVIPSGTSTIGNELVLEGSANQNAVYTIAAGNCIDLKPNTEVSGVVSFELHIDPCE